MAQQTSPLPVGSLPPPPPIPESGVVSTDKIQKYLDENKQLILAILDNQNLGKITESSQYQAQLQRNLVFLAALADEQPQTKAIRAQMTPHGVMPQTPLTTQPITVQPHQQPHNTPPVQVYAAQPITPQTQNTPPVKVYMAQPITEQLQNNPPIQVYMAQPITAQPHQHPHNSLPQIDQSTALLNEEENVHETENDLTALNESSEQEERNVNL